MRDYSKETIKAVSEVRWWSYAAWTLPFVALGFLVFENFVGWHDIYDKTIVIIAVTFFSFSVFWWWWALHKFVVLLDAFKETENRFREVKEDLKETQQILKEDVGNR